MQDRLDNLLKNVADMALKRRARSIVESLDLKDGEKILDVGCGDGFYLYLLSNLNIDLKLTGIDLDIQALESARKNLKGKKIQLIQGDLMKKLPFPDESFDNVVMSEVAEHLPDDIKGLKEVNRILKPEGKLLLTVPCKYYPFFWDPVNWVLEHVFNTRIKNGFWAGIWNQHLRLYSLKRINSVLRSVGFDIEKNEIQTFWCMPFNHYILNLGARFLVGGCLPNSVQDSFSKFSNNRKNNKLASILFLVINLIDKLNKIWTIKSLGVSIFVKARKN